MTTTPFEDGLDSAQTTLEGYAGDALPVVAAVAVAFLGIKWLKRIIRAL
jgi:hypothetical protein